MKKILYILFVASLLAVSCTKEVLVSRNHDLDAEVTDIETKMDMAVLYCNINDAEDVSVLDLQKVGEYVDACSAENANLKVVTFVAPADINGTNFASWLNGYATEKGLQAFSVVDEGGELCMGALVAQGLEVTTYTVSQYGLNHAILHFVANGIHFVVTDLEEARNAVPTDWEAQIEAMTTNKKAAAIVYSPDVLTARKAELELIFDRTMEYENALHQRPFAKDKYWFWTIDMNAPSSVDMKYGQEFARMDCYDYDMDSEAFFTTVTDFFSVSEFLAESDPYFVTNKMMVYNGLVDCLAERSVFTPSSVNYHDNPVYDRNNFVYMTDACWNMQDALVLDKAAVDELGTTHYPVLVTLKSEE